MQYTKMDLLHLPNLWHQEELLRQQAGAIVAADDNLRAHLRITERAMDLADILRQFPTDDEDLKVVQLLGMRIFNAYASTLRLALCGYSQNAALILRDVLETVFLLDLFVEDRKLIEPWRLADDKARQQRFGPSAVRKCLDRRDGSTSRKRDALYKLFSQLAGHPTMKSAWMMRPEKDGDAVIGPFVGLAPLEAIFSEMGRMAVQVGDVLNRFCPESWHPSLPIRRAFLAEKRLWMDRFYPGWHEALAP